MPRTKARETRKTIKGKLMFGLKWDPKYTLTAYFIALLIAIFEDIVHAKIDFGVFAGLTAFALVTQLALVFFRFMKWGDNSKTMEANVWVLMIGAAGMLFCFSYKIFP